ncbi:hypothetical protein FZC78_09460 [Rossellomorea vietnamensis]|uniref:Uncharacterized protein n=1 Tax=Rossellomorea vietnamensis TaxID=218284 RepID=A0A5D4NUN3_9BACI|nr:DUF6414 family protein [Rossellomorea vietnamensis]TYS18045.1 hypothetical protein FZC78_09460 [Rossellomorea vietnamensis]
MVSEKEEKLQFLKIAYFDEGSALDYLEAKHGGRYDKVSLDIIQRVKQIAGEMGGEASTDPKILSFVVDSLFGLKGRIAGSASYNRTGDNKVSETLSSTVLSNFIEEVANNKKEFQEDNLTPNFGIFEKVNLSFVPNSITFLKIISPMLKVIKEESFGNEMPIQLGALDQIFNDAKGYYELISVEEEQRKVFRFNFNALRNNYRLNDLTKMNLTVIGIKVGECKEAELEWESEFGEKKPTEQNSAFGEIIDKEEEHNPEIKNNEKTLYIYDVILAGVASDED